MKKKKSSKKTKNGRRTRADSGFTLIETLIAISIASFLFIAILFVYNSFARMTHAQEHDSDLLQQFMYARRIIEKDIHMSGLNLPGNGLYPLNAGMSNFELYFLKNEENKSTGLFADANNGDSSVVVKNGHDVLAKQWICLAEGDTFAAYPIDQVKLSTPAGSDTVKLSNASISSSWTLLNTKVFFAKAVSYTLDSSSGSRRLVRHSFESQLPIGTTIDSIDYLPKDSLGAPLGILYSNAKTLQITLAGNSKSVKTASRMIKSFDAMVRN